MSFESFPRSILRPWRNNSEESKPTPEGLLNLQAKQFEPTLNGTVISLFSYCCACFCSSFGIVCNCTGEGCDLGFNAVVTSEKNKTKISIQVPVSDIRRAKDIYESNNRNASGGPMAVILMVDRHECENFVKDKLRQNITRMNEEVAILSVLADEGLVAVEFKVERLAQKIMTSVYERLLRHGEEGLEKMHKIGITF
ncbi:hypothetical protein DER45DRAFT_649965 [Fusarium avenaceum]|nr:hypothetical protein DER45DRAFT_649965 [Fusarium avenaceum]